MRQRFVTFSVDVWRFTPLVAIVIAVLVNVVNLRNVLSGNLSALDGLFRFAVAFFLALVCVGGVSRLLTSYARQMASSDSEEADADAHRPPGGTGR
ncbi:MAG TPA: hypothetical protein VMD59_08970 [Acidimicrobiales bacterium]|nr:hypothetical protein [Acidimicrobiales bacterium]